MPSRCLPFPAMSAITALYSWHRRLDGEYYSAQVILFCEDIEYENWSFVSGRSRSFPSSDIGGTRLCRSTAKPPGTSHDRDPLGTFRVSRILLFQWCELGVRSRGFPLWRISRERRFCLSRTRGFR